MANPQKENGYTAIANELLEFMAKCNCFGFSNGQITWAVLRKTYGWKKTEDKISISQLIEMTNLSRRMVIYALQELEAKNILIISRSKENGLNKINLIKFNKNYESWVVQNSARQVENNRNRARISSAKLRSIAKSSAKLCKKVVQNSVNDGKSFAPTKETNTKEIRTKETLYGFESFWIAYPKKVGKGDAEKKYTQLKPSQELLEKMLRALAWQRESAQWKKDGGQFIPHPSTWLNQRRWEDEQTKTFDKPRWERQSWETPAEFEARREKEYEEKPCLAK